MKKVFLYCCAILLVTACSKQNESTVVTSTKNIPADIDQYLQCLNFNTKNAQLIDGNIIVEGDIILDSATIVEKMNDTLPVNKSARTEQYAVNTTGVLSWANSGNINYFIDASATGLPQGNDWTNAVVQATTQWNNINGCRVNFIRVFQQIQAEVTFYSDASLNLPVCARNLPANVFAAARFAENNNIGTSVAINDNGPGSTATGKIEIIKHELGHALGFRHSDMYDHINDHSNEGANGSSACGQQIMGGNLLQLTAQRDLNSVMVSHVTGLNDVAFDADDIRAAQILYPDSCCSPTINYAYSTPTGFGNIKVVNVSVSYTTAWNTVRFELLNTSGTLLVTYDRSAYTSSFTIAPPYQSGSYLIRARGINYRGDLVGPPSVTYSFTM